MLRGFGADVSVRQAEGAGVHIALDGGQRLRAVDATIPGDPSSAAFLIAGALISPSGGVLVENVMSNSTRDGFFQAAARMGAELGAEEMGEGAGERLIDLQGATSGLNGRAVPEELVASMIDEFPILAVLAAFAAGETRVTGARELRVKESDRIAAIVAMMRVNGVEVEEHEDGFIVQGCDGPPPGGGLVETHHDHRIAMSALIMGTASQKPVSIDDAAMIATSYPDFMAHMHELGADIREV
jgi:3-phosphoshikimate 1-carboxyvinyltransferase